MLQTLILQQIREMRLMWPQIRLRYQCRDTENTYTVASIVNRNVKLRLCLSHIFCGSYVEEEFIKYWKVKRQMVKKITLHLSLDVHRLKNVIAYYFLDLNCFRWFAPLGTLETWEKKVAKEKQLLDQHFLMQIDEARDALSIHSHHWNPLRFSQNV